MIQKLSAHMKLHIWCSLSFQFQDDSHAFSCPICFHERQQTRGHFLPQPGDSDASLAETSIESEIVLHAFEHRLAFQPSDFAQEGRHSPSVCVMALHNFFDTRLSGFSEHRLDVHACQAPCGAQPHCHASTWEFCPLAVHNVCVANLSS